MNYNPVKLAYRVKSGNVIALLEYDIDLDSLNKHYHIYNTPYAADNCNGKTVIFCPVENLNHAINTFSSYGFDVDGLEVTTSLDCFYAISDYNNKMIDTYPDLKYFDVLSKLPQRGYLYRIVLRANGKTFSYYDRFKELMVAKNKKIEVYDITVDEYLDIKVPQDYTLAFKEYFQQQAIKRSEGID